MFLFIYKTRGITENYFTIINSWDTKSAILDFYEHHEGIPGIDRILMDKMVKSLSIEETISVANNLLQKVTIVGLYSNLTCVYDSTKEEENE